MGNKSPAHIPGPRFMQLGANLSHAALYAFLLFMPISGAAMGYYGGKGLPFFFTTIPGASKENLDKKLAFNSYKLHKQVGQFGEYVLVPAHLGGTGLHILRGENILRRMNPLPRGKITQWMN